MQPPSPPPPPAAAAAAVRDDADAAGRAALAAEAVFEITRRAHFDAAHYLDRGPRGEYRRLHGHSFEVEASVRGPMQEPVGWVADLGELDAALRALAAELDHGLLNEHPGLESPTLERLCLHFAARLRPRFPGLSRVTVGRPTIGERCSLALG